MAVSGTHVNFLLIGLTILLSNLNVSKRKINAISTIFLIIFVFITGFTASVIRASFMAILKILSGIIHRKNDIINSLFLILLLTLIQNPYNLTNISVLLSYGGVLGIALFLEPINKILDKIIENKNMVWNYIKGIVSVSFSVQIIIAPIMIYFYKTISLTFLISNILTSLLISVIIIFGFLIILLSLLIFPIAKLSGVVYKPLIKLLLFITEITAKIPFSKIYVKEPYLFQIVIYYFLIFFLINKKTQKFLFRYKKQIVAIVLIIVIFPTILENLPKDYLKIYFIDVGQGDSCLIITPNNKKILIDGGGSENYNIRRKCTLTIFVK